MARGFRSITALAGAAWLLGCHSSVPKFTSVSVGYLHACALGEDGTAWCWGSNAAGQLGVTPDPTIAPRTHSSLQQVGAAADWAEIWALDQSVCGVHRSGLLDCWGSDAYGLLANGFIPTSTPLHIKGQTTWTSIAGSGGRACGLQKDGTVWCWGENGNSFISNVSANAQTAPVNLNSNSKWIAVAAGVQPICGIKADHSLWCWSKTGEEAAQPEQLGTDTSWASLAAGWNDVCAVKSDGTLWCATYRTTPVDSKTTQVGVGPLTQVGTAATWSSVSLGDSAGCGLQTDGSLWCWGSNIFGQLGFAPTQLAYSSTPVRVDDSHAWASVSVGAYTTCGTRTDGRVWCWGDNTRGELGDGAPLQGTPVNVGGGVQWKSVSVSLQKSYGVDANGQRWGWGHFLAQVPTPANEQSRWSVYSANWGMEAGLLQDGTLWANRLPGLQTPDATKKWSSVAAGGDFVCAIQMDGSLWCGGGNDWGQLGTQIMRSTMDLVDVSMSARWNAVATGWDHTFAIRSDGSLWFWGNAHRYFLPDPQDAVVVPVQIGSDTTWTALSTTESMACGLKQPGTLWCWGYFDGWNVPFGSTGHPKQLGVSSNWTAVSVGPDHACALQADHTLWCWGLNAEGQVGDGTFKAQPNPVQLPGNNWASVDASGNHSCATRLDGTLWCWGDNFGGARGDGTAWRGVPQPVVH